MKKAPEYPISSQTLLNEIRFRIKLKVSEWQMQAKNSYIFPEFFSFQALSRSLNKNESSSKLLLSNQIDQFEVWKWFVPMKFLYLCKLSSTKFDLESNWNFLNEKGRPEIPSNFPQQNSI